MQSCCYCAQCAKHLAIYSTSSNQVWIATSHCLAQQGKLCFSFPAKGDGSPIFMLLADGLSLRHSLQSSESLSNFNVLLFLHVSSVMFILLSNYNVRRKAKSSCELRHTLTRLCKANVTTLAVVSCLAKLFMNCFIHFTLSYFMIGIHAEDNPTAFTNVRYDRIMVWETPFTERVVLYFSAPALSTELQPLLLPSPPLDDDLHPFALIN